MNSPLLDLHRLWRNTNVAPNSGVLDALEFLTDRYDPDLLAISGYSHLDSLAKHGCLFLLGRPGAGKSAEIERLARGEFEGFKDEWSVLIRSKEAGPDLLPEIIRDPKWIDGQQQAKPVRLVIDGLDEGFLREPDYFSRLKRTLENLRSKHDKLRLLLTCRPGLDESFCLSLHEFWGGKGHPEIFALQPLSKGNRRALVEHWIERDTGQSFFDWVDRNHFQEFTRWPRPLLWLAQEFGDGRGGDLTYTELCWRRVGRGFGEARRLSEARLGGRADVWSSAIMLVAATLVFCGLKGIALDGVEPECLSLDDLFRGTDRLMIPDRPALTREDVWEAVRHSDLIEAHGSYFRFANQSDLEFLAGAMLSSLKDEQLRELLGAPDEVGRWRVFPQLASTAANLAAQSPDFFKHLLVDDPRVLMRVDFASKSEDDRRAAIEAMLNATADAGFTGEHQQQAHFFTLRHPGITAQLRPWLFDKKKSQFVRELAFDIALECCNGDLWVEMERAATSGDEFAKAKLPSLIRLFGKTWTQNKLRTWASDEDEQLAGAALDALLDHGLKLRDIAPLLHEPRSRTFGSYKLHFARLSRECTAEDVPAALGVIGEWPAAAAADGPVRELIFALVARGVTALDNLATRKTLTSFLISRYERGDWLLHFSGAQCGLDDNSARRALFLAIAEDWPTNSRVELTPVNDWLRPEDYRWLLDVVASKKGAAGRVLTKFAANLVWQFDDTLREALERAYTGSSEFRAQLPAADETGIFDTIQRLRAESAARHRVHFNEMESKLIRARFDHEEFLAAALKACRMGNIGEWNSLCFALAHPKSPHDAGQFFHNTDPRKLPGWEVASDALRAEMTQFAREFLLRAEISTPAPRAVPVELFGLTYAFSLHAAKLNANVELRAAIRPLWALALLRHPGDGDGTPAKLLAVLTGLAPAAVADACHHEFRERWERNETIFGELLPIAWCVETENALIEVLESAPLQPETYMSGLATLAIHNLERARKLAAQRLLEHAGMAGDSAARRTSIAACLFVIPDLWKQAWPYLRSDRAVAHQLLLEFSRWLEYRQRGQRIEDLPTPLIAGLYELMIEEFPISDAPLHEGGYTPTALDDAYSLRGRLQRTLESRGAGPELSAVYQRCDETRSAWWARVSIDRAQTTAHANRREPPNAAEFVTFLATKGGTFVRDNDSLQRAVLASLQRFEQSLKPDGLVAFWPDKKPCSEEVLQVEIAQHLRREFEEGRIVINMETKILHERSDIRVQAKPYVVTVEVKLGHSADRDRPLRTAMRSQLRAYLEHQNETHGIYVVGWFFCPLFRPQALRDIKTLHSARRYFGSQAKKLSSSGFVLAASVIDCRWPEAAASRAGKRAPASGRSRPKNRADAAAVAKNATP